MTLETTRGVFDRFSAVTVTNELTSPAEAILELGDDGALADLYRIFKPGEPFKVKLNGLARLSGRVEIRKHSGASGTGTKLTVTIRTKLSDAFYCSADPAVRVEKTSVKEFVLGQYAKLGYTEADFIFSKNAGIDLMTGLEKGQNPKTKIIDLAPIKVDAAKAQPTESVRSCVDRHLKRHHATHWDAPDGRIAVGRPNEDQEPHYSFRCLKGRAGQGNNVEQYERGLDWSQVPSSLWVYGGTSGKDVASSTIKGVSNDDDLIAAFNAHGHFYRPVVLQSEQAKTLAEAEAAARRERSMRSMSKDTWMIRTDGWTHWRSNGQQIPYAPDTVADIDIHTDVPGRYLCTGTQMVWSKAAGSRTTLQFVAKGVWVI